MSEKSECMIVREQVQLMAEKQARF